MATGRTQNQTGSTTRGPQGRQKNQDIEVEGVTDEGVEVTGSFEDDGDLSASSVDDETLDTDLGEDIEGLDERVTPGERAGSRKPKRN